MKITLSAVCTLSLITSVAQTTITLNESAIQDAYVWDYLPTTNIGTAGEFEIYAWTYSGTPTIRRGFMQFDLSSLPDNALIQEATLTLYNNPTSTSTSGQHQQLSGSNEIIIQRVLENWQETTVTWDNQPPSSISGTMTIPASQSQNQDYVIDITQFATDWQTNPSQNFGLLIRLEIESYYRSVILASSENANVNLRPHLDITYVLPNAIHELSTLKASVFPNPVQGKLLTLSSEALGEHTFYITDSNGVTLRSGSFEGGQHTVDIANFAPGHYLVLIEHPDGIYQGRFIR